ncbi:NADH dehydrogenase [ubiquinone] 1 beta subcomplex subunit 2, mitochondrial-like [Eriocheir sinensis]|uniref:NADH dehydrogenase [ubiquinone] 1 beta subcomplex subunit 2, mitochondrial-like n=1 Tax=Eriocheir sinensis TaxID=95602 RepID=UPI0021C71E0E|nr:NADH dehydrogenase [ubiquinone] 1 beta subcomplex subunit 2, mitochondrial-like [Eriocheir sinensis]
MVASRLVPLLRAAALPALRRGLHTSTPRASADAWAYRTAPPAPSKFTLVKAEALMAFMWWWVLYHLITEPEHITGEFPYPDPSKWTNEELGIPADDED